MPLTMDEEGQLIHLLQEIGAARAKLNGWEQGFFDDQVKRHDEWGAKMSLSPKQWSVLRKMHEKATEV